MISIIDQAQGQFMAAYCPTVFLCIIMDQDLVAVNKKTAKKERGQHPAILTKQERSII